MDSNSQPMIAEKPQSYSVETFGNITLINADCMEVMRELPDNAFDLAIVDPPYGINAPNMTMGTAPKKTKSGDGISVAQRLKKGRFNSDGGKLKNRALNSMSLTWDCERPSPEYFAELFRISRNQIIWGGNYYDLPPTRGVICWDKVQPWDNFSQWEMAWTSFDRTARLFRYSSRGGGNVEKKIHPTQKPVALYTWLLSTYAKPGDSIIDTHSGSLSIALAAHNLGFEVTAIEIDPEYYQAARERLVKYQLQQKLF